MDPSAWLLGVLIRWQLTSPSVWPERKQSRSHDVLNALFSQVVDNIQLAARVGSVQYRSLYKAVSTGRQGSLEAVLKAGHPRSLVSASLQKVGVVLADSGSVVVGLASSSDTECELRPVA